MSKIFSGVLLDLMHQLNPSLLYLPLPYWLSHCPCLARLVACLWEWLYDTYGECRMCCVVQKESCGIQGAGRVARAAVEGGPLRLSLYVSWGGPRQQGAPSQGPQYPLICHQEEVTTHQHLLASPVHPPNQPVTTTHPNKC